MKVMDLLQNLDLKKKSRQRRQHCALVENMAKKEPQSFHCGSFDHHGLQSLSDYVILFSIFRLEN